MTAPGATFDRAALAALDDAELERALGDAQLASLLAALAYATGDDAILADDLRPDGSFLAGPDAGYDEARKQRARARSFEALRAYRAAGCPAPPPLDDARLRRLLGFLAGERNVDAYFPLLREELALDGADARAPRFRMSELAPGRDFRVAVVGAGMSGLVAALRLQQAGIPFVVLEKNADVGGTWYENTYPGCRVDVPNHFYSYSFAQRTDWPSVFSTQEVLLEYFRSVARDFGLRDAIRFGTEVTEAAFDEATGRWTLALRREDGGAESLVVDAVVAGVGQLNRPVLPDIPGVDDFAGPSFHSARWDASVDLSGKRVAVVGTGASAAQLIPSIADVAGSLAVFQRTPPWILPTPDNRAAVPEGLALLLRVVPGYAQWYRFWLFWTMSEGLVDAARVDPAWPHPERSVGPMNDGLREAFLAMLRAQCGGDDDLYRKLAPSYPPFAKRFVRDDGWLVSTLGRDDVELVTDAIERVERDGVRLASGRLVEADVIVYATGFSASQFLVPMKVTGRGGRDLHAHWAGDARAYLGITVPHFPSLFLMYGPNTNIVVNGSIIWFSECEASYLVDCLRELLARGARALDCRPEVHDAYNDWVDAENAKMAWGAASVSTWYRNARGRISQNWPSTLLAYWQRTRAVDPDDYEWL
ncbi:MAG: NAD(P)/FAD-dependent oxidoreductase [Myxococcota bacterium]|nr:NAD(P)-binding protein [Myxococcales bacterium]